MRTKLDPLKEDWYPLEPRSAQTEESEKKVKRSPNPETMEWIGVHVLLPILIGALSAAIADRAMRRRRAHT